MFTLKEINKICNGKILYNNLKDIDYFSTNSEDVKLNTIFIPLKGKKYDAHKFIDKAIKNKIVACLVSKKYKNYKKVVKKLIDNNISVIVVKNTYTSLINLARYNRYKNFDTFVIAITGSNGKTSTKDLIYDILKNKYNVLKTENNLNNIIGVSKTLLNLNNHDILVIELGMNHKCEISKLSKLVKPNISIITNIGSAHIGLLGSIQNIIKAKLEILDGMDNKLLYINSNNKYLNELDENKIDADIIKYNYNYITYDKKFNYININNNIIKSRKNINPNNISIAYIIAKKFNIKIKNFQKYLNYHKPPKMRMEVIKYKDYTVISDCYNSNYESCINGIDYTINNYKNKKIILVLGDILELGQYSKYYHELLGNYINKIGTNIHKVYLIGKEVEYTYNIVKYNKKEIYNNIEEWDNIFNEKNCIYYLKGSRKINLDKLIYKNK